MSQSIIDALRARLSPKLFYYMTLSPYTDPTAHQVQKSYQALVLGHPPSSWEGQGHCISVRLMDVPGCFARRVASGDLGQAAETTVKVLQRGHWPKESSMGNQFLT